MAACVPIFSWGMARNVQKSAFIVLHVFCLLLLISFLSFNFDRVLKLKFLADAGLSSKWVEFRQLAIGDITFSLSYVV